MSEALDKYLPESHDRVAFKARCDNVFDLVVEFDASGRKWAA